MRELRQDALHAACRALYDLAGDGHVLPSLIRAATTPGRPSREMSVDLDGSVLSMSVRLAEPASGQERGRFDRAPIEIAIEDGCGQAGSARVIDGAQRFELIRAFLLAVRDPIVVDRPAEGARYRVALRLSPDFTMPVDDAIDFGAALSAGDICGIVAERLYAKSDHLFACRETGLAVWRARLEQELFGELRPHALSLWPANSADDVRPIVAAPANRRQPSSWRRALRTAAAVALMPGLGLIAAALGGFDEATPEGAGRAGAIASTRPVVQVAMRGAPEPVDHSLDRIAARIEPPALRNMPPAGMALASIAPASVNWSRALSPEQLPAMAPRPAVKARNADMVAQPVRRIRKVRREVSPLASLGRAVSKLTRSIRAIRLPRPKFTAMNNPYAAGPR